MSYREPPSVPDDVLDEGSWTKFDERRGRTTRSLLGLARVTAYHHTDVYGDDAIRREVADKTLGRVDRHLSVFFVNRTNLVPGVQNLLGSTSRRQLAPAVRSLARSKLEDELRSRGVEGFRVFGKHDVRGSDGRKVELQRVEAEYVVRDAEIELVDGVSASFEGGKLDVNCWVGAWIESDDVYVVGGVHPAEDFERTRYVELSDAVSVRIDVDLGLWPRPYRQKMFELLRAVV
ncbi:MAG: hypothetical protein ACOCT0_05265 [Halobacteriota archaeon]